MARFKPGDIIPIIVYAEMTSFDPSDTKVYNYTRNFDISIKVSDLVIVSNTSHGAQAPYKSVLFQDDALFNISATYDPDYSLSNGTALTVLNSSVVSYQYLCNGKNCSLDPSQMSKGLLTITTLDRLRLGYPYD